MPKRWRPRKNREGRFTPDEVTAKRQEVERKYGDVIRQVMQNFPVQEGYLYGPCDKCGGLIVDEGQKPLRCFDCQHDITKEGVMHNE